MAVVERERESTARFVLRLSPDHFEDVGKILLECGLRDCKAPQRDSDDVDGGASGDTNPRISLLDHFPVGPRNGVREDVSVEHPDRAGKLRRESFIASGVDGAVSSGKALCLPRQCLTLVLGNS